MDPYIIQIFMHSTYIYIYIYIRTYLHNIYMRAFMLRTYTYTNFIEVRTTVLHSDRLVKRQTEAL